MEVPKEKGSESEDQRALWKIRRTWKILVEMLLLVRKNVSQISSPF